MSFAERIERAAAANDASCREYGEGVKSYSGDSAIEHALDWAFRELFEVTGGGECCGLEGITIDMLRDHFTRGANDAAPFHVYVTRQIEIAPYFADFVLVYREGGESNLRFVVVECDGHDFHERTKKQAQHDKRRDRFLQAEGFPVLRLTGSEIWRSPIKTAGIVVSQALHAMGVFRGSN